MYLPIADVKLTQIDSATKGAVFVGTEMYGDDRPSSYVVVDGGRPVQGKLALGLSGKGAFSAIRLGQGPKRFGVELPGADSLMLELGEPMTRAFDGTLNVGQLLVTTQGAYLGVDWYHGDSRNFAVLDLKTWTLQSYMDVHVNEGKALLVNWRLVHRQLDQTVVLAESVKPLSQVEG